MDDDPFASIVKQCLPTSSQQEKFRTCPFARESEVFLESEQSQWSVPNETPVEPTGIVMVSLPESSNDDGTPHEDEEFQTASERSQSQLASSEEQGPVIAAVDLHAGRKTEGVGEGNDVGVSDGCADAGITVDLGKDTDNLDVPGPKSPSEIAGDDDCVSSGCRRELNGGEPSDVFECELKKFRAFQVESSPSKNFRVSDETIVSHKQMMVEIDLNVDGETEDPESGLVGWLNENTVNVVMPVRVSTQGVCENVTKNIEDLDKFKYVHSGSVDRCANGKHVGAKRELPFSIRTKEKNVGGGSIYGSSSSANNRVLNDLFHVLKMVVTEFDDDYEDLDFLKTAKRRGVTFPRPRWWPPEGFDG